MVNQRQRPICFLLLLLFLHSLELRGLKRTDWLESIQIVSPNTFGSPTRNSSSLPWSTNRPLIFKSQSLCFYYVFWIKAERETR